MPDKIDITKKYKCANGAEVKLYAHELLLFPTGTFMGFSGAIRRCGFMGWETTQWMDDGTMPDNPGFSLVEIKPKVRVRGWMNIYPDSGPGCYATSGLYDAKCDAENAAKVCTGHRRACIYIDQEADVA